MPSTTLPAPSTRPLAPLAARHLAVTRPARHAAVGALAAAVLAGTPVRVRAHER